MAFVVHDYNRHHGHSRYVAELATRFKRDHEVHIYANTFEEPNPEGLRYHHVPAIRGPALASILSFVIPGTWCVERGYDVVHAQGLCGLRHDVCTAHICQQAWYRELERREGKLTRSERLFRFLVTPWERLALCLGSTRRVIAISDSLRRDLRTCYRRRSGVSVVYHGVDLETFHPRNRDSHRTEVRRQWGIAEGVPVALYVGHLRKGAAAAIRAVSRVDGVQLVCVSSSDSSQERVLADRLNVGDRVQFLPSTRDIHQSFAGADLFLYPTFYDTFGMVISEAMASGLPVVTSRGAGAAELIDDGVNGCLVDDPWNVEELVPPLRKLTESPELRETVGRAARVKIEPFTWDRTAAETMKVYRDLIASRGRAG